MAKLRTFLQLRCKLAPTGIGLWDDRAMKWLTSWIGFAPGKLKVVCVLLGAGFNVDDACLNEDILEMVRTEPYQSAFPVTSSVG